MLGAFVSHPVTIETSIRLNKYISDSGYCSRREADKLIDSNRVKVNGRRPELGTRIDASDTVTVDGQEILSSAPSKSDRIYIAYNKPAGITCTTERSVKGNIIDAIDHDQRIFPIGRLDKPSEGLILLTSDGDIVNKILRAENAHEKEYLVTVSSGIGADFARKMSGGLPILDTVTKPCRVNVVGRTTFKIILTQGLNRQIRRMCTYLGYDVIQLLRTRIMSVELGKLKPGQWRNLNAREIEQLNVAIAGSNHESDSRQGHQPKRRAPTRADDSSAGRAGTPAKARKPMHHGDKSAAGKATSNETPRAAGNARKANTNPKQRGGKPLASDNKPTKTASNNKSGTGATPKSARKAKPGKTTTGAASRAERGKAARGKAERGKAGRHEAPKNGRGAGKSAKPARSVSQKIPSARPSRGRK